jgi:hypothetical protein
MGKGKQGPQGRATPKSAKHQGCHNNLVFRDFGVKVTGLLPGLVSLIPVSGQGADRAGMGLDDPPFSPDMPVAGGSHRGRLPQDCGYFAADIAENYPRSWLLLAQDTPDGYGRRERGKNRGNTGHATHISAKHQ